MHGVKAVNWLYEWWLTEDISDLWSLRVSQANLSRQVYVDRDHESFRANGTRHYSYAPFYTITTIVNFVVSDICSLLTRLCFTFFMRFFGSQLPYCLTAVQRVLQRRLYCFSKGGSVIHVWLMEIIIKPRSRTKRDGVWYTFLKIR